MLFINFKSLKPYLFTRMGLIPLHDNKQPMGVAEYTTGLPADYRDVLPTQEQFQHLLATLPENA